MLSYIVPIALAVLASVLHIVHIKLLSDDLKAAKAAIAERDVSISNILDISNKRKQHNDTLQGVNWRLNEQISALKREIAEAHDPNDPGYDPEVLGLRKELEFERTRAEILDIALTNAVKLIDDLKIEREALKCLLDDVSKAEAAEDDGFEAWVISSLPQED